MDDAREGWTLTAAEMAQSALAMNLALLHSDLPEARFRARLLHYQATSTGDPSLEDATALVVQLLGPPGATPSLACVEAMRALSRQLGEQLGWGG